MSKLLLIVAGTVYWIVLHRYVWIYMGEATALTALTAFIGYFLRGVYETERDAEPNFYGDKREIWTPWHIICFMAGGITLEGISRFMA
jgi:predicted neutral ceramidase superfamily lipid hydrolase